MKCRSALIAMLTALLPIAPAAAAPVELVSNIFVEKRGVDATGKETVSLLPAERVVPGDRLLFVIHYKNAGAEAAGNFVITNPVPQAVAYVGTEGVPPALVSVDGGTTYGELATLRIKDAFGNERAATPADVTHVQWKFAEALPGGKTGQVAFRAQLR